MTEQESSPLEELKTLVDERSAPANIWRDMLPALRTQASATSMVLSELAKQASVDAAPRRGVDVILVAVPGPSEWVSRVLKGLREAFPEDRQLQTDDDLDPGATPNPGAPRIVLRLHLNILGAGSRSTADRVRVALDELDDISIDYSEPLDLIVITPRA